MSNREGRVVNFEGIETLLEARLFGYDLLRKAFIEEPSKDFIQLLREKGVLSSLFFASESESIQDGIETVNGYLQERDALKEEEYQKLHWDYTRMFIGPYKLPAPPWESAYLNEDRLLFQKETLEVRRSYLKYSFLPKHYLHEADDHLGLELDFMYHLTEMVLEKIKEKSLDEAQEMLTDQGAFLDEHLLRWALDLAEDIAKNAETDFYVGMAKILKGFLTIDREAINELLEEL